MKANYNRYLARQCAMAGMQVHALQEATAGAAGASLADPKVSMRGPVPANTGLSH